MIHLLTKIVHGNIFTIKRDAFFLIFLVILKYLFYYDNLGFYLFHPKNNVLPSYVAWIAVNDVPNNALTLEFDEGETTGVSEIEKMRDGGNETFYDLQGRKIKKGKWPNDHLPKGLYIVNGRKVVVR